MFQVPTKTLSRVLEMVGRGGCFLCFFFLLRLDLIPVDIWSSMLSPLGSEGCLAPDNAHPMARTTAFRLDMGPCGEVVGVSGESSPSSS